MGLNFLKTAIQVRNFKAKELMDLAKFGRKKVVRSGVTDEMLNYFTPFRRNSLKPCTLSEPKYFIDSFEKQRGKDFLPTNWTSLTEEQKVDFIVKDRYSQLVANKIMNNIKNEKVEHMFGLDKNGDIVSYDLGNNLHVEPKNIEKRIDYARYLKQNGVKDVEVTKVEATVHNHPNLGADISAEREEYIRLNYPDFKPTSTFSPGDIKRSVVEQETGYVVDRIGNKFCFRPYLFEEKDNDALFAIMAEIELKTSLHNLREKFFAPFLKKCKEYNEYIKTSDYDKQKALQMKNEMNELFYQLYKKSNFDKLYTKMLSSETEDVYGRLEVIS
jgi:hypothetical protein